MEYNIRLHEALKRINVRCNELKQQLEDVNTITLEDAKTINRQLKKNAQVLINYAIYDKAIVSATEAEKIIAESKDKDLLELARMELEQIKQDIPTMEEKLKELLLPVDPNNDKNVIIEMRPAAGGDEASIFVADLYNTYSRFCETQKWKVKILDLSVNTHGYDHIFFSVSGENVYSKLKFESGVHRVQRVPATESKGRVHTSTITVAVLPELDEIDFKINPTDLRIDTYRASGAGGQHVNRTESAVRITHIPTNIVASCQEGKSQIENRATAMKMLTSKIWEKLEADRDQEQSSARKAQVGHGDRSEKIRTYNYPQNRITDHRINLTLNKLDQIMQGNLSEIIDQLTAAEQSKLMSELKI